MALLLCLLCQSSMRLQAGQNLISFIIPLSITEKGKPVKIQDLSPDVSIFSERFQGTSFRTVIRLASRHALKAILTIWKKRTRLCRFHRHRSRDFSRQACDCQHFRLSRARGEGRWPYCSPVRKVKFGLKEISSPSRLPSAKLH